MNKLKKLVTFIMCMFVFAGTINPMQAYASSKEYPMQEMNIVNYNESYLKSSPDNSLSLDENSGNTDERWKFVYVKNNVFKIINMDNGLALTADESNLSDGSSCTLKEDKNSEYQYWYISGVCKDVNNYNLYYKITAYDNKNLSLTISDDSSLIVKTYNDSNNQKWLLNSAGLQGFAGYSLDMDGNKKSSTIGGVLGKTVYVNKLSDLVKYANDDTPRTIVITKNISVNVPSSYKHVDSDEKLLTKIKVGRNKSIIGAYGVSLNNIYFYLDSTSDSGNFIIKNLTLKHDENLDLNNFIPMYISQGQNFWIDHCTFQGHDSYNSSNGTLQEIHDKGIADDNHPVDKFVYVGVKADYVTISDSKFDNHEYGLILGYPNEASEEVKDTYTGYPRMTISNNYFSRMYCRAPGLMRYGYYHSLNNYVDDAHLAFTLYTNATIYSENSVFEDVKSVLDDKGCMGFTDKGSSPELTAKVSPETSWNPEDNYEYIALDTSEVKEYCEEHSGAQASSGSFTYASYK